MKKMFLIATVLLALSAGSVHAQTNRLLEKGFWESKPDVVSVKAELDKGFDFKDVQGMQDPIALAINNDAPVATIRYLLDQPGVDLDRHVNEGRIYLHLAAYKGQAEVVDHLLSKGSDMYYLDANGHTALTFPGFNGKLTTKVIDVFLKHGLDIHKRYESKDGANILLLSIPYDKDLVITDHLLSKGLSLKVTDNDGNTAFNHAAKIGNVALLKELRKRGVKYNENALILASQGTYRTANTIEVYQYLVDELKINPKVVNKEGQNVLHSIAKKRDQTEVVEYFLKKGVDVNKVDKEGNTPFINAAGNRNFDVVKLMLPKVKNINAKNNDGESALLLAVSRSTSDVVSLLLANKADINIRDKKGNTLAYYLIESYPGSRGGRFRGDIDQLQNDFVIKLKALEAKGLDLTLTQEGDNTLYHLAAAKNDLILLKSIAHLNIDINVRNKGGLTALHKAAMVATDDAILRYLIDKGADKKVVTSFDETAYDLASENELLAAKGVDIQFLK